LDCADGTGADLGRCHDSQSQTPHKAPQGTPTAAVIHIGIPSPL
jgi:hypothetical protein